jgi:hypothetical protein
MKFRNPGLATLEEPVENHGTFWRFSVFSEELPLLILIDIGEDETSIRGVHFEATTDAALSLRELRRLPLQRVVDAARAYVAARDEDSEGTYPEFPGPDAPGRTRVRDILLPRGRPGRTTYNDNFYRAIATAYIEFTKRGLSPAREIAKRKRVDRNTVDQWVHRSRQLGFLPPAPPRRRAKRGE